MMTIPKKYEHIWLGVIGGWTYGMIMLLVNWGYVVDEILSIVDGMPSGAIIYVLALGIFLDGILFGVAGALFGCVAKMLLTLANKD